MCLGILCLASTMAAPLDYLADTYFDDAAGYHQNSVDHSDQQYYHVGPSRDELLFNNQYLYYPEDPALYLDDSGYGFRNPGTKRNPQYYNYYFR